MNMDKLEKIREYKRNYYKANPDKYKKRIPQYIRKTKNCLTCNTRITLQFDDDFCGLCKLNIIPKQRKKYPV